MAFDLPLTAIPELPTNYVKVDGSNVSDELIADIQGDNEAVTLSQTFRVDVTNVDYYAQITPASNQNTFNTIRIRLPSSAAGTKIDTDLKRLLKARAWVKIGDYLADVTTNATRSLIGASLTFNFNYNVIEGTIPTGSTPVSIRVVGKDVHRGELGLWAFLNERWQSALTQTTTAAADDLILVYDISSNEVKAIKKSDFQSGLGGGGASLSVTAWTVSFTARAGYTIIVNGASYISLGNDWYIGFINQILVSKSDANWNNGYVDINCPISGKEFKYVGGVGSQRVDFNFGWIQVHENTDGSMRVRTQKGASNMEAINVSAMFIFEVEDES